ncbi:hypothetical protein HN031_00880 [Nocardioides sp. zg-1308]|uniref:Nuclear transport factor 2 family protein n=1 Tax=Nocardioides renjunii TaxID=3095075 RepID=A0ABU5KGG6_9ACTN|nr:MULTISPECIES: hypothetical protein [unclassified Nocardioides]MDZ5664048.1 hypothetical protein [Nocardioides sp. S-58]NPD03244.1 hypothetical protein [Nocardioides sp. zg-1308]
MGHLRLRPARTLRVGVVVAIACLAAGCSPRDVPEDRETPGAESAALRVQTVAGAERLDEATRAELEGAVGDVLSTYVVKAFLGDFPRQEFVGSFEAFTSGAARSAAGDIRRLTATKVQDATDVRATELDARLSFLTRSGEVHGGTATVHFAFEATMEDGRTRPLVLDGRFLLDADSGTWSIFGYDVRFDDGAGQSVETESAP